MTIESDLQTQAERLSPNDKKAASSKKITWLAKLNLLSSQAQETIRVIQSGSKSNDVKDDIPDALTAARKVEACYRSYLSSIQ